MKFALPVAVGNVRESRGAFANANPPRTRTRALKSSKPGTTRAMCSRIRS